MTDRCAAARFGKRRRVAIRVVQDPLGPVAPERSALAGFVIMLLRICNTGTVTRPTCMCLLDNDLIEFCIR